MTEEDQATRRRSRSAGGLRTTRRSQRRQQHQEEGDEEVGVEGEQELGGGSDDDAPAQGGTRRSRSQNALRQSRRRNNRSFRQSSSNTDADADADESIADDQSTKSTNTTKLNRTSRIRNRRSANAGTEDQEPRSRSNSRRLEGRRTVSSGALGEKRPSVGAIAAGTDLGLLENNHSQRSVTDRSARSLTERSARSLVDRADSVASDEKFLQERKSRQDEILGQVMGRKGEVDTSESGEVEEDPEKPKSRTRRPSLTRLTDARKRVQERMAKGSGEPSRSGSLKNRDAPIAAQSDEEGEMDLMDDYDATQLEDRQKSSLVDRISNVAKTPEKSKRKVLGSQTLGITGPLGGNKSNWDI